jgi:O-methyltransferase involved in polyketide biosynthesis
VILGAGLDSFAQRRPEIASRLTVFEIDHLSFRSLSMPPVRAPLRVLC